MNEKPRGMGRRANQLYGRSAGAASGAGYVIGLPHGESLSRSRARLILHRIWTEDKCFREIGMEFWEERHDPSIVLCRNSWLAPSISGGGSGIRAFGLCKTTIPSTQDSE